MNLHEPYFKTRSFEEVVDALRRNFNDAPFEVKTERVPCEAKREMITVTVPRRTRVEFTLSGSTFSSTEGIFYHELRVKDVSVKFHSYELVKKRCNYHYEFCWYVGPDTTVKAWNSFMASCRSWHIVVKTVGRSQWYDELKLCNHKSLDEVTPRSFTAQSRWATKASLAETSVGPFVPDSQPFVVEVQKNTVIAAGVVSVVSIKEDAFLTPANDQTTNPWFLVQCRVNRGTRGFIVYDGKNSYYRASPDSGVHRLCVSSCEPFDSPLSASDKAFLDEVIRMWLEGQDRRLLEEKSA